MAEKNDNDTKVAYVGDSYQAIVERAEKTYSPVTGGNYQPLIPTALEGQGPTPPVGVSGVSSGKNSGAVGATPSARNSSSD